MTAASTTRSADIFCRVIDNYGDIGVCLRLARALARDHGWRVRLWVDAPEALQRLEPAVQWANGLSSFDGLELVHWQTPAPALTPYDICIEAFACDPPAAYLAQLTPGRHLWLNLEYLSAEPWVGGCHLLPSPQRNGVPKYFYFPGFLPDTGGLLREPDLLAARDAWQASREPATALLGTLGLPAQAMAHWHLPETRLINLFCYPHAPLEPLLTTLAQAPRPTLLLVPEGVAPSLSPGRQGALYAARHAFVRPPDFDRLLWSADLNCVRGEDSLVRAIWAGRPLLWHIYPQTQAAHLDKLQAWLDQTRLAPAVQARFLAWNAEASAREATAEACEAWRACLDTHSWQDWCAQARADSDTQAARPDLASQLVAACTRLLPMI